MVFYVRISDDPEGLEMGVERQEPGCRAYAESLGFEVVEGLRADDTSVFKQCTITLPMGEKIRRVIRPRVPCCAPFLARGGAEAMIAYGLDHATERAERQAERWEQIAVRLDSQCAAHRIEGEESTTALRKVEAAAEQVRAESQPVILE